jgi:hypothetical protein
VKKPVSGQKSDQKGGRPRKLHADKATLDQVAGLAQIHCTEVEASAVLHVARTTFRKFLDDYPEARAAWEDGFGTGKVALRRSIYREAQKGGAVMIFAAKNWLGMADKQEVEHNVTATIIRGNDADL